MAGRLRRQPASVLEIRGISRGSMIDHPRIEPVNEVLMIPALPEEMYYYDSNVSRRHTRELDSDDDDDESTIVGGSGGLRSSAPHSPSHSEDTVTASDASHYWSAGNSFTTGNTTERSSVYSWGDDEFDLQASRLVRQMFQAIEKMLFEGVLSGSTSLQQECREWMATFPHLRILGKQILPCRDEGFFSIASNSQRSSTASTENTSTDDVLEIKGSPLQPKVVPAHFTSTDLDGGKSHRSLGSDLSHLKEEIYAQDGHVVEYLAYDIREMDEEEHSKKYHVPRRRRLGFPPITPNACVRDAVFHHIFDVVWLQVINCLSGSRKSKSLSLLQLLVDNLSRSQDTKTSQVLTANHLNEVSYIGNHEAHNLQYGADARAQQLHRSSVYPSLDYDDHGGIFGRNIHEGVTDREAVYGLPASSSFLVPPLSIPQRLLFPDSLVLPPSRGSYLDQSAIGGRHIPFASGRLSTAPHPNTGDINSLNDLMKISQKKLQARSDRIQNEELSPGPLPDSRFSGRPSSSHYTSNMNPPSSALGPINHHLSAIGITGTSSPLAAPNRPFTSRDFLPRQTSATRKGKVGRLARLHPLDRAKTPNVDYDGLNIRATKLVPGHIEPSVSSFVGPNQRVNSPPHSIQPPLTAPNPSTGSGTLWFNSRLPPITSSLESLPENTLSDFRRTRGRTAGTRISSAIADEVPVNRAFENVSRPNTTHTFRADNFVQRRAGSVTPSNLIFGAQGNSISIPGNSSPARGGFSSGSSGPPMPYPQYSAASPDPLSGLVGITGKSISLGVNSLVHSTSPDEEPGPPQSSWGPPSQSVPASQTRRKRQVLT